MIRIGLLSLGAALALAACQPTATYYAYDDWDYDFRYSIYDDYWDNAGDIDRPDRPRPPGDLGPRPTPPIYTPSNRPSVQPVPSNRPSSARAGGGAGRSGGAGSLRGGGRR
jgi:hypothetical protein